MATVITGRDVTISINSVDYEPQTLSVTLAVEDDQQVYETFGGPVYKTLTQSYVLDLEMLSDWGTTDGATPTPASTSLCEALETAFDTAPDTSLNFSMVIAGPNDTVTMAGKVFPKVPAVSGAGADASTVSVSLQGDVNTALTVTDVPNV